MSKKTYLCPVCGFDGLKEPPLGPQKSPSYEICPCCGFEPGFDAIDDPGSLAAFRQKWIEVGSPWFMPRLKPKSWDLKKQMKNLLALIVLCPLFLAEAYADTLT